MNGFPLWQLTRTERATCRADPLLFGRTRVRYSGGDA
jgi:hypothetical protein